MKVTNILFITVLFFSGTLFAQTPPRQASPKVTPLNMPANSTVGEIVGNIRDGQKIPLRWAEKSSVACFPGTRFEMFDGNHVLYRVTLPAASAMTVTVVPAGNSNISLYALRQSNRPADQTAPPNVNSAISCEASYPIYANLGGGRTVRNKDDGTRRVEYISVNSPYSVLIGVAGAKGATEGEFKLRIEIKPR